MLKAEEEKRRAKDEAIARGDLAPTDKSKIRGSLYLLELPDHYESIEFVCKDCDKEEVWTARQQKLWFEEWGGLWDTTAVRCRECRKKERARKAQARKVHLDGLERKRASRKMEK